MSDRSTQSVELADCGQCGCWTINPTTDNCPKCGTELYPVSKIVQPNSVLEIIHDEGQPAYIVVRPAKRG